MMKSIFFSPIIYCIFFVSSCHTPKPEKYLDIAVLNCSVLAGFAHMGLSKELENPPVKIQGRHGENIFMSRQKLIEDKIRLSKKILADIKDLSKTSDTRDILTSSIDLHQFVIKVYETDYMLLAKLYDQGATNEKIRAMDSAIKNKHATMFELHYENLMRGGKLYADKYNLHIRRII